MVGEEYSLEGAVPNCHCGALDISIILCFNNNGGLGIPKIRSRGSWDAHEDKGRVCLYIYIKV